MPPMRRIPSPVFNANPDLNTFEWTGLRSRADTAWDVAGEQPGHKKPAGTPVAEPGTVIDFRPFLRDTDGAFPIFRRGTDFYAPRTAMNGPDGQAVNALTVPYAVLSTALRRNGHVRLGDVGLAIRPTTGISCSFLFADAGGGESLSVGECSAKLVRTLFGGPPTNEAVSFLVFPRTSAGDVAMPDLIPGLLQAALGDLADFANVDEIVTRLAQPQFGEPLFVGRAFVPRTGFRRPVMKALADEDSVATVNVEDALRRAGLP